MTSQQPNGIIVFMIPNFDGRGGLPAGIHKATWPEFAEHFGWNQRRKRLLEGLRRMLDNLSFAGCPEVYIDGSFVTAKEHPADFDGCWKLGPMHFEQLDPVLLKCDSNGLAQQIKYGGHLFPSEYLGHSFLEFFQYDRDGVRKGVVHIGLGGRDD